MTKGDPVDYPVFDRLRRDIQSARQRRSVWLGVTVAAIPVGFGAAWSSVMNARGIRL